MSRSVRRVKERAVARVLGAWTRPGPHAAYHIAKQKQLRRDWPMLVQALDQLVKAAAAEEAEQAQDPKRWGVQQ